MAHRWIYEIKNGEIKDKKVIDHLCRNRKCVNLYHLECVSMAENTKRGLLHTNQKEKFRLMEYCSRGHLFSLENTKINKKGNRMCVFCQKMKAKEWRVKNRGRVNYLQNKRRAAIIGNTHLGEAVGL